MFFESGLIWLCGNKIARKWVAQEAALPVATRGGGIVNRDHRAGRVFQLEKSPLIISGKRDGLFGCSRRLGEAVALVREEEVGLVLAVVDLRNIYRTSEGGAEVVPVEDFDFARADLIVQPGIGIEPVALEIVEASCPCNSLVPDFVVTLMLPPLARLFSALNAAVSIRNSSTESTDGVSRFI